MNSIYLLYEGSLRLNLLCVPKLFHGFGTAHATRETPFGTSLSLLLRLIYQSRIRCRLSIRLLGKMQYRPIAKLVRKLWTDRFETKKWQMTFKERLFTEDIRSLMDGRLDEANREKISLNERFM